jgi:SAM-dependent methyltransferase
VQPRLDRGRGRDRHPVLHPAGPGRARPGARPGRPAGRRWRDRRQRLRGRGRPGQLAQQFPACRVVGVDDDAHSIEQATARVAEAGLAGRVELVCNPLEDFKADEPAALVVNNISMHECRDIDLVTGNVLDALEPGGWFVISDFPFPDTDEGLPSVPGRIMGGIQFFEAQIDDQLLPRAYYDGLLTRHQFTDLGSASLTPMHALTWGRRPVS